MRHPPNAAAYEREQRKRERRPPRGPGDKERIQACRDILWSAQEGHCAYCGQFIPPHLDCHDHDDIGSLDHVIPWIKGGADALGNFVLMHRICNQVKSDDMPNGCVLIWLLAVNARMGVGAVRW